MKYLNKESCIDKSSYVKAMEGSDMQKNFSDQISVCTHTWAKMILRPYFYQIPEQIKAIKE